MPILSQIFVVFGQKILIFTGERNSFGTHITEKPPRHLIRIIFWSGMGSNGPQMPIFGQKKQFWAKLGRLWAKIPNFCGSKVSVPTKRKNHLGNLSTLFFGRAWDQMGQKCRYLAKFDCFWGRLSKTFGILISGNQWDTFSVLKTLTGAAPIGRQGRKCAI